MPKQYTSEFRRKVLDLLAGGRRVAQVAADLDIRSDHLHLAATGADRHRPAAGHDLRRAHCCASTDR
jgi:hypothetical protein